MAEPDDGQRLCNRERAARALAVSPMTIDRFRALGMPCLLVAIGAGQEVPRFDLDECRRWLEEHGRG